MLKAEEIKDFLEDKYQYYHNRGFINNDPISIPHLFSKKEDIEIAGFLTAIISWGNRKSILTNANKLMQLMDYAPHEFVTQHGKKDLVVFKTFVHRTFNGQDCVYFLKALQHIYQHKKGLEQTFISNRTTGKNFELKEAISGFRKEFLSLKHELRTEKHISDPLRNSSAKRLCMFLRWMVRKDNKRIDFGIWNSISPSELCLPLDIHTGRVSRLLGLTQRTQQDWKTVEEITGKLKEFDPRDPIKYDFALFGLGVEAALG